MVRLLKRKRRKKLKFDLSRRTLSWILVAVGLVLIAGPYLETLAVTFAVYPAAYSGSSTEVAVTKTKSEMTVTFIADSLFVDFDLKYIETGDELTAFGTLKDFSTGGGLGSRTVKLMETVSGTYYTRATTTTSSTGSYTLTYTIPLTAGEYTYFVNWDGDSLYYGAYAPSGYWTVRVESRVPQLTLSSSAASATAGTTITFSGKLADPMTGTGLASRTINLEEKKSTATIYSRVAGFTSGSDGKYSGSYTLPSAPGTYSYRTHFPGDSPATTSNVVEVTVKVTLGPEDWLRNGWNTLEPFLSQILMYQWAGFVMLVMGVASIVQQRREA